MSDREYKTVDATEGTPLEALPVYSDLTISIVVPNNLDPELQMIGAIGQLINKSECNGASLDRIGDWVKSFCQQLKERR